MTNTGQKLRQLAWLLCLTMVQGATYYCSPTGSGNGASRAAPMPTSSAGSISLAPGDTLVLMSGVHTNPTYGTRNLWKTEQTIRINAANGNSTHPITITAEPGAVLKGDGPIIFQLRISRYVRVIGLTIVGEVQNISLQEAFDNRFLYRDNKNGSILQRVDPNLTAAEIEALKGQLPKPIAATRPALYSTDGLVVQSSSNIEILNNSVSFMPATGISVAGSDYITARHNVVHDCSRRSSVGTHGFVVQLARNQVADKYNGTRYWIEYNKIYDNYNEVYSWSELKDFVTPHIDEGKGFTIQKSSIATSQWNYGRLRIANNVCYGNGFSGIHLNIAERVDIVHNTVFNNFRTGDGNQVGISVMSSTDVRVVNNIAVAVNNWSGSALSSSADCNNTQFLNNLVAGTIDEDVAAFDNSSPTLFGNPEFMDSSAMDFRLSASSPARGKALSGYNTTDDFLGTARDSEPDIGALEYPSPPSRRRYLRAA